VISLLLDLFRFAHLTPVSFYFQSLLGSDLIRTEKALSLFCSTRFLHAKRYPFRLKTLWAPRYFSGFCSSNPCMRNAHCTPTTAPFTGCSNSNDAISVNGR